MLDATTRDSSPSALSDDDLPWRFGAPFLALLGAPPLRAPSDAPAPVAILDVAFATARDPITSRSFTRASSYESPHPGITSSYVGRPKAKLFVGDTLYRAGFAVPTYARPDGSLDYKQPESWPLADDHFERIRTLDAIRAGDVLVVDYHRPPPDGAGAHVEIITEAHASDGRHRFGSLGARDAGLIENGHHGQKLTRAVWGDGRWRLAGEPGFVPADLYVLRPRLRISR